MVDAPLYYYLQNPASVTRNYLPDYMDTFRKFYADKSALAARYGLDDDDPEWRESTCWAGLLIAIGNEFAAGNPARVIRPITAADTVRGRFPGIRGE